MTDDVDPPDEAERRPTHDAFGAIDPDEVDGGRARRRWPLVVAGVLVVALAATALAVTKPWDGDSTTAAVILLTVPGASDDEDDAAEPTLDVRQVLGEVPEGFGPSWLDDGSQDPAQGMPAITYALFAGPGTTIGDGPWLSFEIAPVDGTFSASRWIRENSAFQGRPDEVVVNGLEGARSEDFQGFDLLVFGPLDGRSVVIRSTGIAPETIVGWAGSLRIADGVAALAENEVTSTVPLLVTSSSPSGLYSYLYGGGASEHASISYIDLEAGNFNADFMSLNTATAPADDPFPVIRFLLADITDTTVHGQPAIVGQQDAVFDGGRGTRVVTWIEGGRLINLSGLFDEDELLELAESVTAAGDDEWADLEAEATENQNALNAAGGGDPFSQGTFLVGAGNTADGSRWRIEANYEDEAYGICYAGGGNNGMGCQGGVRSQEAVLTRAGDSQFGYHGVIALVDGIEDARLEISIGDADPIVIPLHDIDDSFPGGGAAWAGNIDQDFTADLVDADGKILESMDIEGRN